MKRITFLLTDDQFSELDRISKSYGVNISVILREIINNIQSIQLFNRKEIKKSNGKSSNSKVWEKIKELHWGYYKVDLPRNARINSIIKQLVDRIGIDKSIAVIDWFYKSPNDYYQLSAHELGLCLRDYQKLLTEFESKRIITPNALNRAVQKRLRLEEEMKMVDFYYNKKSEQKNEPK